MILKPERITIGKITSTHGHKGEVRVYPLTDFPERFSTLDEVTLEAGTSLRTVHVEGIKNVNNMVVLKFREVTTMNEAETLRGAMLQLHSEQLVPLPEGHYYLYQIVGMTVVAEGGEDLGVVEDIRQTGSNDVYYVKNPSTGEEILIPAIKEVVKTIDLEKERIIVSLPPGLRGL
ncbi:MAG: ribosome maturation factor RimM [Bacillota bacterium]